MIISKIQRLFIWTLCIFYLVLYTACNSWLHVFNILAGNLQIKQNNRKHITHCIFFLFLFTVLSSCQTELISMVLSIFSVIFFHLNSPTYFYLLHSWTLSFPMSLFFSLFWGNISTLFPPSKYYVPIQEWFNWFPFPNGDPEQHWTVRQKQL